MKRTSWTLPLLRVLPRELRVCEGKVLEFGLVQRLHEVGTHGSQLGVLLGEVIVKVAGVAL